MLVYIVMVNDVRNGCGKPMACFKTRLEAVSAITDTIVALRRTVASGHSLVTTGTDYATLFSRGNEISYTVSIASCEQF